MADVHRISALLGGTQAQPWVEKRVALTEHARSDQALLVAVDVSTDQIIGCGYIGPWLTNAEISDVYVCEDYRRQGIGLRIMHALIAEARRAGYGCIELTCLANNIPALTLYRKLGFTVKRPLRSPEGELLLLSLLL